MYAIPAIFIIHTKRYGRILCISVRFKLRYINKYYPLGVHKTQ